MTMRTEKELRAELADKGLAPASIDALVKAEKEAKNLKAEIDDEDESEEDEAAAWDKHGDEIKKAREAAQADLNKAATVNVDTIKVQDPGGDSPDPEQRSAYDRTPVDPDIDNVSTEDIVRDIQKAVGEVQRPLLQQLAKAFGEHTKRLVDRLELRLQAQTKLLDAALNQGAELTKAAIKNSKRVAKLQKALDLTPADRRPRYTVQDVDPIAPPAPAGRSRVDIDDLSAWINGELEKAASSTRDTGVRQRIEDLSEALNDLDAGTRNPDQIAKAVGYPKA